jgi:hypothetical protein
VNWSMRKKKKLLKIIIRKAGREWECHYGTKHIEIMKIQLDSIIKNKLQMS